MSPLTREKLESLAEKWSNGTISEQEKQTFIDWFNEFGNEELHLERDPERNQPFLKMEMWQAIQAQTNGKTKKAIRFWPRIAVAVAILTVSITGVIYYNNKNGTAPSTVSKTSTPPHDIIAPVANRATINLPEGKTIYLDEAGNGTLATINNVRVNKLPNGQLTYEGSAGKLVYNTLINPKGSKVINVVLSDGTKVWLNCGSSLRYPVAFVGKDRSVDISGEGYFEVTEDAQRPFKVNRESTEITVLGTHFNVNAYEDELNLKATLLQGSVKVTENKSGHSKILTPGQQVQVRGTDIRLNTEVDVQQVTAWKSGLFSFRSAEFSEVMRELARWYDLEVVYEGGVPKGRIRGEISKDLSLSQIMTGLGMSRIKYQIKDKEIRILPL